MRLVKFLLVLWGVMLWKGNVFATSLHEETKEIGLQNPYDRTVIHCRSNDKTTAEDCARYYENKGFVRFRDIPYKTAVYDILKVDTYPTRRWRDFESTPRW